MRLNKAVQSFLQKHRIGVLTVVLEGGQPHSSTMHYAETADGIIYFMTDKSSIKGRAVVGRKKVAASFVTGFSDEEWITLQMDGVIDTVTDKNELIKTYSIYFKKNAGPEKYKSDPETLFLEFTPNWYRYTEYKPEFRVISSKK